MSAFRPRWRIASSSRRAWRVIEFPIHAFVDWNETLSWRTMCRVLLKESSFGLRSIDLPRILNNVNVNRRLHEDKVIKLT